MVNGGGLTAFSFFFFVFVPASWSAKAISSEEALSEGDTSLGCAVFRFAIAAGVFLALAGAFLGWTGALGGLSATQHCSSCRIMVALILLLRNPYFATAFCRAIKAA